MAGEILLRAEDARGSAGDMKREAASATENFDSLNAKLQSLADSFRGQAAQSFDDRYNEWKTNAKGVIDALEGLGDFLEKAANTIEEVDETLANQLKG
jgi:WXG100 family type VII secretion target